MNVKNPMLSRKNIVWRRIACYISTLALCFSVHAPATVMAVDMGYEEPEDIGGKAEAYQNIWATGGGDDGDKICEGSASEGGDVDKFLKALAHQESGGNPKAQNPVSSASGKFQYITDTWQSRYTMYPPAKDYANAKDAPENIQDAVAYIEYSKKFQDYGNSLFNLAVSHFYPAALSDKSLLDATIGGNTITPREYGESVVKKIEEGVGKDIELTYNDAPEFEKHYEAFVGSAPSTTAASEDTSSSCESFSGGDLSETTLAYAWPEYHEPNYTTLKPPYEKAVKAATSSGRYVGGGTYPGVDCGGFVTTLLVDSGFEPKYNHGGKIADGAGPTPTQEAWANTNWTKLGSGSTMDTGKLEPGDVAFSPGHTFVYVGSISGFKSKIASASYSPSNTSWRSPMAGAESLTSGEVTWYRKK